MKIRAIFMANQIYTNYSNLKKDKSLETTNYNINKILDLYYPKSYVSFGWCEPHIDTMNSLNDMFTSKIEGIVQKQNDVLQQVESYKKMKQTKYDLMDKASATAAKLFTKYANQQFATAEMIPSYALALNKKLQGLMQEHEVLKDPVKTLIAINDITKQSFKPAIDKNTGTLYTENQTNRAKLDTQLYATYILLEQVKKNVNNVDNKLTQSKIMELIHTVSSTVKDTYGEDAFERIAKLSNIGKNPTLEEKQASLNLIKEFDEKGKELNFGDDFETKLQGLIDFENERLGKTIEPDKINFVQDIPIKLSYHTHAQIILPEEKQTEKYYQELKAKHEHGIMTKEEHNEYHQLQHQLNINHGHNL